MPRTPPYLATPAAPPAYEWHLTHAATILPQADPATEAHAGPILEAAPDPARCTGPRADTCTQATTGPCLPRVCPGCLSSDTPEAYHHTCHGKAAALPSTCARTQAAEAAQTCQAQTDPHRGSA